MRIAARSTSGRSTSCEPRQQDEILKALEQGEVELPSLSSKLFFDLLWRNTEEGFFADPLYGGNKDKVGWKLIGFPGVPSGAYREHLDKADVYRVGAGQHSGRAARQGAARRARVSSST